MNRQTKQLLALAGVLAVGLGAYAALRVWNAGEEEREAARRLLEHRTPQHKKNDVPWEK